MSKLSLIFISFGIVVSSLVVGNIYFGSIAPVKLNEKSFSCGEGACNYSFELVNTIDKTISGTVHIHFRNDEGTASYKSTAAMLPSIETPFNLDKFESMIFTDSYFTEKERVRIFYAVSITETSL